MSIWKALLHELVNAGAAVMATVVGSRGSVPREGGARMVIGRSGSFGTIGGGNLEWQVMAEAQALLRDARDGFRLRNFALGPVLGQCCGGAVTVAVETFTTVRRAEIAGLLDAGWTEASLLSTEGGLSRRPLELPLPEVETARIAGGKLLESFKVRRRQVHLFGAGHVGRAVAYALAPLPFDLVWLDERRDSFPENVAPNTTVLPTANPTAFCRNAPEGSIALVMTHSHGLDLDIVFSALNSGRYAYVGVIGSDTKRARFVSRLRQAGLDEATAGSFACPIGVAGIRSKEPAVIAASVAAECLLLAERLATRSSAEPLRTAAR